MSPGLQKGTSRVTFSRSGIAVAIASTVLTLGLLLAAEGLLRWIDPVPTDSTYDLFLEQSLKYLQPCAALQHADPSPPGRPRLVVIGESSGELLGDALRRLAESGAAVQVANCAQGGSAFRTLTQKFDEALAAKPEAISIAFGHNYDFEEPLTRWQVSIQYLRVHSRLMSKLMTLLWGDPPRAPMRIANDLHPFEEFLRRAARQSRERGVRLVLNTMTSNLLYPPIQDAQSTPQIYEARFLRAAHPAEGRRRLAEIVDAAADAGAAFELGIWLEQDGDLTGARAAFERAVDLDNMHFRASAAQAEMIRRVAKEENLALRDTAGLWAAAAPDTITGWETVLDNCHLHRDLFATEAFAQLELLGVDTSALVAPQAASESEHFDAVLKYLGNWIAMATRAESEWMVVAPLWRFLRMNQPGLEERFEAWLDEQIPASHEDAARLRALLLAAAAQAHWLAGDRQTAEAINQRARDASAQTALPWVWNGLYAVAEDRLEDARRSFAKSVEIEPGRNDATTYLRELR